MSLDAVGPYLGLVLLVAFAAWTILDTRHSERLLSEIEELDDQLLDRNPYEDSAQLAFDLRCLYFEYLADDLTVEEFECEVELALRRRPHRAYQGMLTDTEGMLTDTELR